MTKIKPLLKIKSSDLFIMFISNTVFYRLISPLFSNWGLKSDYKLDYSPCHY